MNLDLGCGTHLAAGWVGIDAQDLPGVALVHDLNIYPWPVESESVDALRAWHILEHISPVMITEAGTRFPFIEFFNECWRIAKRETQIDIESPYGLSPGFINDPTHCHPINEKTFYYFDPAFVQFEIYRPKPWRIVSCRFTPSGNINAILQKSCIPGSASGETRYFNK